MVETAFEPEGLVSAAERKSLAQRAKQMEGKCDRLTIGAREMCARTRNGNALLSLVDQVENATDCFDEAAFLISLAPENDGADGLGAPLAELARIATAPLVRRAGARIEAAILIPRGKGIDADFALQCVDAVIAGEREADAAERARSAQSWDRKRCPGKAAATAASGGRRHADLGSRPRDRPRAGGNDRPTRPRGDIAARTHVTRAFRMISGDSHLSSSVRAVRQARAGGACRIESGGTGADDRASPARAAGFRAADEPLRKRHRRRRSGDQSLARGVTAGNWLARVRLRSNGSATRALHCSFPFARARKNRCRACWTPFSMSA